MLFQSILLPTDFSEHSLRAFDFATEIAQRFDSELHVVYVLEPYLQSADLSWTKVDLKALDREHAESARRQLDAVVNERIPDTIPGKREILFGKPFVEILKFAKRENTDLIVMSTHGRGVISHILMGSTAEKVVRKAPCPVLTVKHPKQVFSMPY